MSTPVEFTLKFVPEIDRAAINKAVEKVGKSISDGISDNAKLDGATAKNIFSPLEKAADSTAGDISASFRGVFGGLETAVKSVSEKIKGIGEEIKGSIDLSSIANFSLSGLATAGIEGAVGAIAGAFSGAISAGFELNNAVENLRVSVAATGGNFEVLKAQAEDAFVLGVGESVAEATDTIRNVRDLLQGAFPDEQIGKFTAQAQAFAKRFDLDVNEVVKKSVPLIKQYGLSGEEAFNTIALAAQNGASAQDDVLDSLAEYSQLTKEAGFSALQFADALSRGAAEGAFNTDKIADSIKEAQIRIKAGDFKQAFSDIIEGSSGASQAIAQTINGIVQQGQDGTLTVAQVLEQSTKIITDKLAKGEITESFASQLQIAIAGTPAEDLGVGLFNRLFSQTPDEKLLQDSAKKAGAAYSGYLGQFTSLEGIGRQFQLFVEKAGAGFVRIADSIIAPIAQNVGETFAKIEGLVLPIINSIGDDLKDVFSGFIPILENFAKAIGFVAGLVGGALLIAFKTVTGFFSTFFAPVINGIGTVLTGVIGFVQEVINKFGELFTSGNNAGGAFLDLFNTVGSVIAEFQTVVSEVADVIFTLLLEPLKTAIVIISQVIDAIGGIFGAFSGATDSVNTFKAVLGTLQGVFDNIRAVVAGVAEAIKQAFEAVRNTIKSVFEGDLLGAVTNVFGGIKNVISGGLDAGAAKKFEIEFSRSLQRATGVAEKYNQKIKQLQQDGLTSSESAEVIGVIERRYKAEIDALNQLEQAIIKQRGKLSESEKKRIDEARKRATDAYEKERKAVAAVDNKSVTDSVKRAENEEKAKREARGETAKAASKASTDANKSADEERKKLAESEKIRVQALEKEREIAAKKAESAKQELVLSRRAEGRKLTIEDELSLLKAQVQTQTELAEKAKNLRLELRYDEALNSLSTFDDKLNDTLSKIDFQQRSLNIDLIARDAEISKKIKDIEEQELTKTFNLSVSEGTIEQAATDADNLLSALQERLQEAQLEVQIRTALGDIQGITEAENNARKVQEKINSVTKQLADRAQKERVKEAETINAILQKIKFEPNTAAVDAAKQKISELNTQAQDIETQYAAGQITFEEYIQKTQEIQAARVEAEKAIADNSLNIWRGIGDVISGIFAEKNAELQAQFAETQANLTAAVSESIGAVQEQGGGFLEQLSAGFSALGENISTVGELAAETFATTFAEMFVSGDNALTALKKSIISLAESLVNTYAPAIIALFASVIPPPFGVIAGTAAVGLVKGLLASAKAQFARDGEDFVRPINGGYVSTRTDNIPFMLAYGEAVINARSADKNRDLIKFMNANPGARIPQQLNFMTPRAGVNDAKLSEIVSAVESLESRLDYVANTINRRTTVDVKSKVIVEDKRKKLTLI